MKVTQTPVARSLQARSVQTLERIVLPISAAIAGAAYYRVRNVNPYRVELSRHNVKLPPHSHSLRGTRMLFVSDLHAGPAMPEAMLTEMINCLGTERYDLLLLGGDYVSSSARYFSRLDPLLTELVGRAGQGTVAVIGNHDLSVSGRQVKSRLEQKGITVLRNCAQPFTIDGTRLWVAGMDDSLLGRPDIAKAFAHVPPDEPVIALWHEPDLANQTAAAGAFLQLSGHSHGGQIRVPFVPSFWTPPHGRRNREGWNIVDGMPVFTSRGVGVFRPPLRFNCPPEMTLLTLT